MNTPFPARPSEVVPLTPHEFTGDVDVYGSPSLVLVCRRFLNDENRALVWFIRFKALRAWCTRSDLGLWLTATDADARSAWEVAASFTLNDDWEFDVEAFRGAVDSAIAIRSAVRAVDPKTTRSLNVEIAERDEPSRG